MWPPYTPKYQGHIQADRGIWMLAKQSPLVPGCGHPIRRSIKATSWQTRRYLDVSKVNHLLYLVVATLRRSIKAISWQIRWYLDVSKAEPLLYLAVATLRRSIKATSWQTRWYLDVSKAEPLLYRLWPPYAEVSRPLTDRPGGTWMFAKQSASCTWLWPPYG